MKLFRPFILLGLAATLSLSAFGVTSAGRPGSTRQYRRTGKHEELFLQAVNDVLVGHVDAAREELQAILGQNPENRLWKAALLALADSFCIEGGSENLAQADAGYREFLLLFPDDELGDEVRIKLADTDIRWMRVRDQSTGFYMAERELEQVVRSRPDSIQGKKAVVRLTQIYERLAEHQMKIARFYLDDREAPGAARHRTEEILNKYPDYSRLDEALFYHARSMAAQGGIESAGEDLSRLVKLYPHSEYRDRAASLLRWWGLSVPESESVGEASRKPESNNEPESVSLTDVTTLPPEGVLIDRRLTVAEIMARTQRICGLVTDERRRSP